MELAHPAPSTTIIQMRDRLSASIKERLDLLMYTIQAFTSSGRDFDLI